MAVCSDKFSTIFCFCRSIQWKKSEIFSDHLKLLNLILTKFSFYGGYPFHSFKTMILIPSLFTAATFLAVHRFTINFTDLPYSNELHYPYAKQFIRTSRQISDALQAILAALPGERNISIISYRSFYTLVENALFCISYFSPGLEFSALRDHSPSSIQLSLKIVTQTSSDNIP